MKTYINSTLATIVLVYETSGGTKQHSVMPGQRFTFDLSAENGAELRDQLAAAGATEIQEGE